MTNKNLVKVKSSIKELNNLNNEIKEMKFLINIKEVNSLINNYEFVNSRIQLNINKACELLNNIQVTFANDINNSKLISLLDYQEQIQELRSELKQIILTISYFYGCEQAASLQVLQQLSLKFKQLKAAIKKFSDDELQSDDE